MRIMAIDYGDAHTGIAISDPTGFLTGFSTVITAYRPEVVVDNIVKLVQEHGVEELVLGHPINMDGTRGPRSEKAHAMKALLEESLRQNTASGLKDVMNSVCDLLVQDLPWMSLFFESHSLMIGSELTGISSVSEDDAYRSIEAWSFIPAEESIE